MELTKRNYVDKAEKVMNEICYPKDRRRQPIVTTSKIRSILAIISEIYNDVLHLQSEQLNDDLLGKIQYLKMRIAYEAGRDKDHSVRNFVEKAELFKIIDEIGENKENLMLFCRYMEALVAYHRYYGGKDL